ncbi:DUF4440 domain-containing protein [Microbacteriaceae bacterium VKM Ac-2855]|nr:DUF4440 domain-containing protein [Microbacteriaceae bacterium VKM Ac-2855]
MSTESITAEFFDRYTAALLSRDAHAVASLYAVPALILFPQQSIPVSDAGQAAAFFGEAFTQYEGVTSTRAEVAVAAESTHSIWADVTWHHSNDTTEHHMYQLVYGAGGWRIAVLTPLA